MNEMANMILIFLAGLSIGALYFVGLWLTVRKAVTATKPGLLVLGSFVLRIGLVLIGFYFLSDGNWKKLLIALFGFIIARFLVIHFTKTKQLIKKEEFSHET